MLRTLLLVDDDRENLEMIKEFMSGRYRIVTTEDPREAARLAEENLPDLILLDVEMPGMSGFDVCEAIREQPRSRRTAVMFLTAEASAATMQRALSLGAVDYMTKPFRAQELINRIEFRLGQIASKRPLLCGNLSVDPSLAMATVAGRVIRLGNRGMRVLETLVANEGRALSRDQIMGAAWDGGDDTSDRAVDLQIFRLRKELKGWDHQIEAIYGKGYAVIPNKSVTKKKKAGPQGAPA